MPTKETNMRISLLIMLALVACFQLAFAHDALAEESDMPPMVEGAIVHIEIPASDIATSSAFYNKLFGWESMEMMPGYSTFTAADGFGGAYTTFSQPSSEGGVLFYIYCADLDSKLPEIEAAGGTTVQGRTPIPTVGWMALFKDPAGNVIGLFSGENVPEGELPPMAPAGS
jgi:predicted enzyme related to lactoylglutathione lyase